MKKVIYPILFVFALVTTSCGSVASKLYAPTEANAAKANVSVENLIEGKVLYMNKCNKCHGLKKPSRYSTDAWQGHINRMQERAKITDNEKQKIFTYLTSEIME